MRCFVRGRVQGVWFRGSTRKQALQLGLSGYARNLPDGRVEVLACGEPAQVERLKAWLWQGPPAAQVTDVSCEQVSVGPSAGFTTG